MDRRDFLKASGAAAVSLVVPVPIAAPLVAMSYSLAYGPLDVLRVWENGRLMADHEYTIDYERGVFVITPKA